MNRAELIEYVGKLHHFAKKITYRDIKNSGNVEKFLDLLGLNPYLFNEFSIEEDEYVLGYKFASVIQNVKNGEKITEEMGEEILCLQALVVDLGIFNIERKIDFYTLEKFDK